MLLRGQPAMPGKRGAGTAAQATAACSRGGQPCLLQSNYAPSAIMYPDGMLDAGQPLQSRPHLAVESGALQDPLPHIAPIQMPQLLCTQLIPLHSLGPTQPDSRLPAKQVSRLLLAHSCIQSVHDQRFPLINATDNYFLFASIPPEVHPDTGAQIQRTDLPSATRTLPCTQHTSCLLYTSPSPRD